MQLDVAAGHLAYYGFPDLLVEFAGMAGATIDCETLLSVLQVEQTEVVDCFGRVNATIAGGKRLFGGLSGRGKTDNNGRKP